LAACGKTTTPEPRLITKIERTCISVADYLFDCPKPVPPDPATADEQDVARFIVMQDKALDDCRRRAATVRAELAGKRCMPAPTDGGTP
jgi:hypothetical protein